RGALVGSERRSTTWPNRSSRAGKVRSWRWWWGSSTAPSRPSPVQQHDPERVQGVRPEPADAEQDAGPVHPTRLGPPPPADRERDPGPEDGEGRLGRVVREGPTPERTRIAC